MLILISRNSTASMLHGYIRVFEFFLLLFFFFNSHFSILEKLFFFTFTHYLFFDYFLLKSKFRISAICWSILERGWGFRPISLRNGLATSWNLKHLGNSSFRKAILMLTRNFVRINQVTSDHIKR